MILVKVVLAGPPRDFYVNNRYHAPWGQTGASVFVEPGSHVFETLTEDREVDNRGEIIDQDEDITVHLQPVVPPEAI